MIRQLYAHGLVCVCGFENISQTVLYAIRPTGTGDVGETHVVWKLKKGVPHVPSPLIVRDDLFFVNDKGIAACLDAKTGREHWKQRIGGNFSASLIHAGGKIYCFSEQGTTTVFTAARTFESLAENRVDGRMMATPAVSGRSFFVRTETHLYRIEKRS